MYKVTLVALGNPDHNENPFCNIVNGVKIKNRIVKRPTIKACQKVVSQFIAINDLGSGNWTGGKVYDANDNYVGYISYNGRFWDKETEYGKENEMEF